MLPNEKVNIEKDNNVLNIGINVSGLLWNGGYTRNNQFGLKFNYKAYIRISPSISWVLDYYIISDYNLLYILN